MFNLPSLFLRILGYDIDECRILSIKALISCFHSRSHISIGNKSHIGRRVDLRIGPGSQLVIGKNCKIDDDVRLIIVNNSKLTVADNVKIGKGSILNCGDTCSIGDSTLISGYCYIQCSSHGLASDTNIRAQSHVHSPIIIGRDCLVGAFCFISPGSILGDGSVCGAHSFVKGTVEPYTINSGIPAQFMRSR